MKIRIARSLIIVVFAAVVILAAASPVYIAVATSTDNNGLGSYVADFSGVLSDSQLERLEIMAERLLYEYECEVSVILIDDFGDMSAEQAANKYYSDYRLGYGPDRSCALLLIGVVARELDLAYWGFADKAFTPYGAELLLDEFIVPLMANNEYYDASAMFYEKVGDYFALAAAGTPISERSDPAVRRRELLTKLGGSAVVALIVALGICLVWKSQMKSARMARAADRYIPEGGFNLTGQQDLFLYRTVTRRKIERSTNSGSISRGGSTRSGGGGHTSRRF